MTWADRLLRLAGGDRTGEVAEHLHGMHRHCTEQAQRLAAAAAQAPTAGAEEALRDLAARQADLATALAAALAQRQAPAAASAPAPVLNGAARNHWARLVAALEACRAARSELARATPRLIEADASLAPLLEIVDRGYERESLALRALIARADPQALN
jgi:hypothetical protein